MFAMEESWIVPESERAQLAPGTGERTAQPRFENRADGYRRACRATQVRVNFPTATCSPRRLASSWPTASRRSLHGLCDDPDRLVADFAEASCRPTRLPSSRSDLWPGRRPRSATRARRPMARLWAACAGDFSSRSSGSDGFDDRCAECVTRRGGSPPMPSGPAVSACPTGSGSLLPRGAGMLAGDPRHLVGPGASTCRSTRLYPAQRLATMLGDAGAVRDRGRQQRRFGAPGLPPGAPPDAVVDLATLAADVTEYMRPTPVPDLPPSAAAVTKSSPRDRPVTRRRSA